MKSDLQLDIERQSEHLIGSVWYVVDYNDFTISTVGPLKRWIPYSHTENLYGFLTDESTTRWWTFFKNKQNNNGKIVFENESDAMEHLKTIHKREIEKYENLLTFHRNELTNLIIKYNTEK